MFEKVKARLMTNSQSRAGYLLRYNINDSVDAWMNMFPGNGAKNVVGWQRMTLEETR